MLSRWMRQVRKVRPWMVAVALAAGAPFAVSACGDDDDSGRDVPTDATEATDGTGGDDGDGTCRPAPVYGPALCTTDAECTTAHGPGWACTGYTTYPDGCGGTITWGPMCEEVGAADADADADADVDDYATYYGPPPADADADVSDFATYYGPPPADAADDDSPAGWYGPPPTDASDVPGNLYGPPPPDDASDVPASYYGPTPADL